MAHYRAHRYRDVRPGPRSARSALPRRPGSLRARGMITITRAPPYLTVQDGGRKRSRSSGVPPGGAMDLFALEAANAMVGNPVDAAAFEWALGGGTVRFERDCVFAIGGATARATLSGRVVAPCTTTYARAGDELSIDQIITGRFLYLACNGGIDVPSLLGSRSTYLPGRFGGYLGADPVAGQHGDRVSPPHVSRIPFPVSRLLSKAAMRSASSSVRSISSRPRSSISRRYGSTAKVARNPCPSFTSIASRSTSRS